MRLNIPIIRYFFKVKYSEIYLLTMVFLKIKT